MGHDPLAPGMAPVLTRVLAVGGDTTRLHNLVTNLGLLGYQVTSSSDPAAAMEGLRLQLQGGQGFSFHVVMVDMFSEYPGGARAVALELFEFALREPQLCAYAIRKEKTYGPLAMEDLHKIRKYIYTVEQNGPTSPEATPDGHNTSPATMSTITNVPFSGRRVGRRSKKHISNTDSQEVGQDGEHAEEQQQSSDKPKRARVVWTDELHKKFVEAFNKLLPYKAAVPKKILELMNDPTLTRENIASHLQKHRLNLIREACTHPPLRRSHCRRKQHRSTPQASFPAPNMSRQQDPPTIMHGSAAVYGNHMVIHMQTLDAMDKRNKPVLIDVSPKGMCPGDDDPIQNSESCVGNSDGNSLHEDDISAIWNKEPEPSWDEEFLSNGD